MTKKSIFSIKHNFKDFYYISHNGTLTVRQFMSQEENGYDGIIAIALNMPLKNYRRFMLGNFNCYVNNKTKDLYFPNHQDAIKALDWINSVYLMNEISI